MILAFHVIKFNGKKCLFSSGPNFKEIMPVAEGNTRSLRHGERARSHYYQPEDFPRNVSRPGVPTRPTLLLQD